MRYAHSARFGYTWGEKPNLSALLKGIAERRLKVSWGDEVPPEVTTQGVKAAIEKIKQGLDQLSSSC